MTASFINAFGGCFGLILTNKEKLMESFRSRIESILMSFHNIHHDKRVAVSQILKEIEGIAPEEKIDFSSTDDNWVGQQSGFNACREQLLKSLRGEE